ncbi:T9SS type A sorting domain-containing protein [Flavobacterium subsaxonicum]|uniref:T9SS type A sorting domain-containing protein n=1 Tax=Flavobacterium subsaxonicum TaxID=426226 RepID=UPI0003F8F9D6|nr:T9SS type A sorting domain-containing protein [Flavobacterium subsaxonicum]
MKKLLLCTALFASVALSAQTTHVISWFMGVSESQASMTVNAGDIVKWTWDDTLPHTVTSASGGAETFASAQLTGANQEYSHTFTVVGSTDYACAIHPMMAGTITTQPLLAVDDVTALDFDYFPNPATDVVTINGKNTIDRVVVYDIAGRQLSDTATTTNTVKVYLQGYTEGTYLVKVFSGSQSKNITLVKK